MCPGGHEGISEQCEALSVDIKRLLRLMSLLAHEVEGCDQHWVNYKDALYQAVVFKKRQHAVIQS